MKPTTLEEYGLRCLLRVAREGRSGSVTIGEISRAEGISVPNVAKLMRVLRRTGFVASARGQAGGYRLSRPAEEISVGKVLSALGGRLYEEHFCDRYPGIEVSCAHTVECSIRSLWQMVQIAVDQVLEHVTLADLMKGEPVTLNIPESAFTGVHTASQNG